MCCLFVCSGNNFSPPVAQAGGKEALCAGSAEQGREPWRGGPRRRPRPEQPLSAPSTPGAPGACRAGNFSLSWGEAGASDPSPSFHCQSIGKGSLWCIDPEYRQNLIQALKKTPYHAYSHVFNTPPTSPQAYQSTSGPPTWPVSAFFKRNGVLLQDPDIDAASAMMLLNTPPELQAGLPPGVIQNGSHGLSRGMLDEVRPVPINPIGSVAAGIRNGIGNCRLRTESEPSCDSPVVSSDPKEDHNYSSAKSSNNRSTSPASDSISTSSADDHYEFVTKGSQDGSEGSIQSQESHSEAEEEDKKHATKEAKDPLADSGYASHKKKQHLLKAKKPPSDTLPLKKRRTEKPPESDDEEMKEAAGSLLHLAGIRSCLNNITNRTAKGQKEQKEKETTKN
ncbi:forkhead box protein N3 isoform X4 [Pleurodeles waltl]|uniref:forkhead box protein N3 isoform X4 n=1 Tax=Pleurodeles waltl TaxID=8319 RepID=UPI003709423E